MRISLPLAACLVLSACNLAPDYKVPETAQPAAFKETGPWIESTPQSALPRVSWWKLYGDPTLNGLEDRIEAGNPTLAQAVARYDAARGYLEQAQSSTLPTVEVGGHTNTDKQSANRPLRSRGQPTYYGDNLAGVSVSWDLDLWGRIRNEVAAGKAEAQASFADLESVRLSLQALLADDYLDLREMDAQAQLLRDAIVIYRKALDLTNYRHDKGIASGPVFRRAGPAV
jgi:outer membrane protein TolC